MTIDEAIAKYKEITNIDAICPAHCNISCDKCVQESEQLVEWLEELKTYRECNVCEYNKAIDDFVQVVKNMIGILEIELRMNLFMVLLTYYQNS